MASIKDLISGLKKAKDKALNDNEGWIRQGKFTPVAQYKDIQKQNNQLPVRSIGGLTVPNWNNPIGQDIYKSFGKGLVNSTSFGLVQPKYQPQTSAGKIANVAGNVAGFVNPLNPLNKGMTALNVGGKIVSRIAPKAAGTAPKIAGGVISELGQTAAYTGAQALAQKAGLRPNDPITPQTFAQNLAFGAATRGLLSPQIRGMAKGTQAKERLYSSDLQKVREYLGIIDEIKRSGNLKSPEFLKVAQQDVETYRKAFGLTRTKKELSDWGRMTLEDQFKMIASKMTDLRASGEPIMMGFAKVPSKDSVETVKNAYTNAYKVALGQKEELPVAVINRLRNTGDNQQKIYLRTEAFKEILRKHSDPNNVDFNNALKFVKTLNLPDRIQDIPQKDRTNFLKRVSDEYLNTVGIKLAPEGKSYVTTSFLGGRRSRNEKLLSEGLAVPSSRQLKAGVDARNLSTSANNSIIPPPSTKGVGGEGVKLYRGYGSERPKMIGSDLGSGRYFSESLDVAKTYGPKVESIDPSNLKLKELDIVDYKKLVSQRYHEIRNNHPLWDGSDTSATKIMDEAKDFVNQQLSSQGYQGIKTKIGKETIYNIFSGDIAQLPKQAQETGVKLNRSNNLPLRATRDIIPLSPSKGVGTNVKNFQESTPDFRATRRPGDYSNVPEIDNPLLTKEGTKALQGQSVQTPPESPKPPGRGMGSSSTSQWKPEPLPWEVEGQGLQSVKQAGQVSTPEVIQGQKSPVVRIKNQSVKTTSQKVPSNGSISPAVQQELKKTESSLGRKVNALDWVRTPDRVLKKIGLGREAEVLRGQYNKYLDELPKEMGKITSWYDRVKSNPSASKNIFKYLDGQSIKLQGEELQVAREIKSYLKDWADKLDLPYDSRIASYITHIFEKDFIKKEFDEDLAKIIADRVPGSVYDPFLQKRLGQTGYVEDVFRALDAYVKRATRKYYMDPALEMLQKKGEALPLESLKYVKSYVDKINLRPTDLDNYLDSFVKQSPIGYKLGQRPTASVTRGLRRAVYRGTLGLNFGSALRNLTQGANTYAKLGEKYTLQGYARVIKELATNGDELKAVGVLRDDMIQDRQISAVKGLLEKADGGLFAFFNLAEKINRGAAYFGAKAKYLAEGLPEGTAIKKAVDLVRDTQFTFGSVDTPVALQSDIVKFFTQFQSYNVKQTEFLAEMVQNKELAGLARWIGANAILIASVGSLIGMDWKDTVPFSGFMTGQNKIGETPPVKLTTDIGKALVNAPDKYGNISKDGTVKRVAGAVTQNLPAFIPGGVQIKKTVQGLSAVNQEGSYSKTGRLQYPIEQSTGNYVRAGLFGKNNLSEAQEYFDSGRSVLGEKQTEEYKNAVNKIDTYNKIIQEREQNSAVDKAREQVRNTGEATKVGEIYLYKTQQFDSETGGMKDVVKSVDLGKQIPQLNLTGQTELDKKLKSAYKSAITSKITDIRKIYELGLISAEEAERQIRDLQSLQTKSGGGKKLATGTVPKLKISSSKLKVSLPKVSISSPTIKIKSSQTDKKVALPTFKKQVYSNPRIKVKQFRTPTIRIKTG